VPRSTVFEIPSYSRARGLFADVSLEASTLRPDNGTNKKMYGKDVSAQDIVFKKAVFSARQRQGVAGRAAEKASPENKSK
jgi:lipid-binding SYLF domain-containing protein